MFSRNEEKGLKKRIKAMLAKKGVKAKECPARVPLHNESRPRESGSVPQYTHTPFWIALESLQTCAPALSSESRPLCRYIFAAAARVLLKVDFKFPKECIRLFISSLLTSYFLQFNFRKNKFRGNFGNESRVGHSVPHPPSVCLLLPLCICEAALAGNASKGAEICVVLLALHVQRELQLD